MSIYGSRKNSDTGETLIYEFAVMQSKRCKLGLFWIGTKLLDIISNTMIDILSAEKKEMSESKSYQVGLTKIGNKLNTEDRKSTRLNSSHVAISYAVFCLK